MAVEDVEHRPSDVIAVGRIRNGGHGGKDVFALKLDGRAHTVPRRKVGLVETVVDLNFVVLQRLGIRNGLEGISFEIGALF